MTRQLTLGGLPPNSPYTNTLRIGVPSGTRPISLQTQMSPSYGLAGANQAITQGTLGGLGALDAGVDYTDLVLGVARDQARNDIINNNADAIGSLQAGANNAANAYRLYGDAAQQYLADGLNSGNQASIAAANSAADYLTQAGNTARNDINNAMDQMAGLEASGLLAGTEALVGTTATANDILGSGNDQARNDLLNALGGANALRQAGLYGGEDFQGSLGYLEGGISDANSALSSWGQRAAGAAGAVGGASADNSELKPFIRRGNEAGDMMLGLLTPGGAEAFEGTPGYQFALEEQERALLRNQAATGLLGSGNTLKELQRNANGLAAQDFGNHIERLNLIADRGGRAAGQAADSSTRASIANAQARAAAASQRAGIYADIGQGISNNFMTGATLGSQFIDGTYNTMADDTLNTGGALAGYGMGTAQNQAQNLTSLGGNLASLIDTSTSRTGAALLDSGSKLANISTGVGGGLASNAQALGQTLNSNFSNYGTAAANNANNIGNNIATSAQNAANNISGLQAGQGLNLANLETSLASQQAGYGDAAAKQGAQYLYGSGLQNAANSMAAGNSIANNIQQGTNNLANLNTQTGNNLSNIIGQGGNNLANLQLQGGQLLAGIPTGMAQNLSNLYIGAGNNASGPSLGGTANNPGMLSNFGNFLGGLGSI